MLGAQAGLRGTLRLGMMQVISVADVGSLIARFHRERPLVDIQPRTAPGGSAALISDVTARHPGCRLRRRQRPGPARTDGDDAGLRAACCSAARPITRWPAAPSSRSANWPSEPFVDYTPGWGTRTIADQLFARAGVERSIGIEVPDGSIHASLVRAGLGLAILPESMIESAGLAGVPLRPAATFSVAFVVAADRPPSPVTQAFADLVTTTHQPDQRAHRN